MNDIPARRIDIVSDVVCPWCIIGYRQLRQALDETGMQAEIHWQPFELNPAMPAGGQDLREHLAEKYGSSAKDSAETRARLTSIGAEVGFEFNFTDDLRMVNTFNAHRMLHVAASDGKQTALKMALCSAFFTDHRDISDWEVLVDLAESVGMDRQTALGALSDEKVAVEVRAEQRVWTDRGIRSVPSMVFDGKYLVSGAQGVEAYLSLIDEWAGETA